MEFSKKDFNADKVQQYEEVRKGMAYMKTNHHILSQSH